MKKTTLNILFIIVFIGCLMTLGLSQDLETPAPFGKAKEMALKVSPDHLGRHILFIQDKESNDGVKKTFLIGYLSRSAYIGIGITDGNRTMVVEHNEKIKTFYLYDTGRRMEIEENKAIDLGFMTFGELVAKGLI